MQTGALSELSFTVADDDTARALGSGSLDVLATPRLVAWCEAATCAAVASQLGEGETTVGTRVDVRHTAASVVGAEVAVRAELVEAEGRRLRFAVTAHDGRSEIGTGTVERAVVDVERFLARLREGHSRSR